MTDQPETETWSTCKCGTITEGTAQDNEQSICPDCKRTGCYITDDQPKDQKHTPGPWGIGDDLTTIGSNKAPMIRITFGERGAGTVGFVIQNDPEAKANADLFASAPSLLADRDRLLEALRDIAKGEGPYSRDQLTFANNTIEAMVETAQSAISLSTKEGGEG